MTCSKNLSKIQLNILVWPLLHSKFDMIWHAFITFNSNQDEIHLQPFQKPPNSNSHLGAPLSSKAGRKSIVNLIPAAMPRLEELMAFASTSPPSHRQKKNIPCWVHERWIHFRHEEAFVCTLDRKKYLESVGCGLGYIGDQTTYLIARYAKMQYFNRFSSSSRVVFPNRRGTWLSNSFQGRTPSNAARGSGI